MLASSIVNDPTIAVVIPAYRVRNHILDVIAGIGPECSLIYVIDDACPDQSGRFVEEYCGDPRVLVLRNERNQGVGGAVMAGYRQAIADGADIMVKIDGDGQMDPVLLGQFVEPILRGDADYTKGNRFFDLREIGQMPLLRRIGNLGLSFMAKASTGYWDIFDPTNGYTAIHRGAASVLPMDDISRRYFFETDMLFRLNTFRATVVDVPMDSRYGNEVSSLKVSKVFTEFLYKHAVNMTKRLLYNYYLRDLSIASFELAAGLAMLFAGVVIGGIGWIQSVESGQVASAGTVMIPVLLVMLGVQLVLAFLAYDIANVPRYPLQHRLRGTMRRPIKITGELR
jgi:dolichol-phosphate mannosyltransferase